MTALASFATSSAGRMYVQVCDRFDIDPGAPLEEWDDVLAFNLRAALAMVTKPPSDEEDPTGAKALADRARIGGARVRALVDG